MWCKKRPCIITTTVEYRIEMCFQKHKHEWSDFLSFHLQLCVIGA